MSDFKYSAKELAEMFGSIAAKKTEKKRGVISYEDKQKKLARMKKILDEAWNISNELIGDEENSFSRNAERLQRMRMEIGSVKAFLSFVKYEKDNS